MTLAPKDLAWELMRQLALPEAESRKRLALAADADYWRKLNPQLSVCGNATLTVEEGAPLDQDTLARVCRQLDTDGYLEVPPFIAGADVERLRRGVERLREEGWPPVFLFVYDEAWDLARLPLMRQILTHALGAGYREDTLVWCFHVAPRPGASGWAPHCDGREPSNRLTLWFALTDATLDNSCMYIVPQQGLPSSLAVPGDVTAVHWDDISTTLRATRALPIDAGGVLGWRFHVLHWSSVSREGSHPRISLALEFLGRDASPLPGELPLVDGATRPASFELRLFTVGKSLGEYEKFEPWLAPFRQVGEALEAAYRPVAGTI
jgi:hypothetical protein